MRPGAGEFEARLNPPGAGEGARPDLRAEPWRDAEGVGAHTAGRPLAFGRKGAGLPEDWSPNPQQHAACPPAPGPGSAPCERQNSVVRCCGPTQGLWLPRSGEVPDPGRQGRSADQFWKDAAAFLSPAPSLGPCVRPTFEAGAGTPAFWARSVSCRWRHQLWSCGGCEPAEVNRRASPKRWS